MSTAETAFPVVGRELPQAPTSPKDFKGRVNPDW